MALEEPADYKEYKEVKVTEEVPDQLVVLELLDLQESKV